MITSRSRLFDTSARGSQGSSHGPLIALNAATGASFFCARPHPNLKPKKPRRVQALHCMLCKNLDLPAQEMAKLGYLFWVLTISIRESYYLGSSLGGPYRNSCGVFAPRNCKKAVP